MSLDVPKKTFFIAHRNSNIKTQKTIILNSHSLHIQIVNSSKNIKDNYQGGEYETNLQSLDEVSSAGEEVSAIAQNQAEISEEMNESVQKFIV